MNDNFNINDTYTIEITSKKRDPNSAGDPDVPLFYCRCLKNGEHLFTRQTENLEMAYLLALQLLSKEWIDDNIVDG